MCNRKVAVSSVDNAFYCFSNCAITSCGIDSIISLALGYYWKENNKFWTLVNWISFYLGLKAQCGESHNLFLFFSAKITNFLNEILRSKNLFQGFFTIFEINWFQALVNCISMLYQKYISIARAQQIQVGFADLYIEQNISPNKYI